MGVPLDLGEIYSGFFSADAYNANNTRIEEAVDKALDRTGSSDNSMLVDLDMGLNSIFNVKAAVLPHEAVNLQQLIETLSEGGVDSLVMMEPRFTAVGGEEVIPFETIQYTPTTNSLMVFVDGVYQRANFEYLETGTQEITFTPALTAGQVVDIFGSKYDAQQYVDLAIKAADSAAESEQNAADSAQIAQDAADIATSAAGYKLDVNNQTGVTYTLELDDEGDFVRMDNPLANKVIVPPASLVNFEEGTVILVRQVGDGTTEIQAGLGVTVNAPYNDYEISQSDFGIALVKIAPDTWDMVKSFGGVATSDLVAFTQEFEARLQEFYNELLSADPTFIVNFDALQTRVDNAIDTINQEFDTLEQNVTQTVSDISSQFGVIQANFDLIEIQFNALQDQFNIIQPEFVTIQNRFDNLEGRFNTIESDWIGIDNRMDQIESDLAGLNIGQGDFDASVASLGYQKLPSGLIMQWGVTGGVKNKETKSVDFPIPFPNQTFTVSLTTEDSGSYVQESMFALKSYDTSGFRTSLTYVGDGKGGNPTLKCYWFAIGH